ncbi:MAG: M6 family metalloprotease domain-containing protein [Rhodoferax sp.]|nr:M6 family metalloprotease domain-containing protein [Rhodoferax sp.]
MFISKILASLLTTAAASFRAFFALSVFVLFLGSSASWAAPVNKVVKYPQPDGSTLQVRVVGDEFFAEETTPDGRHIIKDPKSKFWSYARLSSDGTSLESTGIIATDSAQNVMSMNALHGTQRLKVPKEHRSKVQKVNRETLRRTDKGQIILRQEPVESNLPVNASTAPSEIQNAVGGNGTVGTKKGLTLLIRFPDRAADVTITRAQVDSFANQMSPHYTEFGNNGSIAEFFYEVSNGRLNYTNNVANYYTAKKNRSYYTDESISQGTRARELITEALVYLEANNFDFRTVDADGDGVMDALNAFYAGPTVNAWAKGLWPHASSMSWTSAKTGKRTGAYQITDMGDRLELGTFAHENGHMLAHFPDIYDYDGDSVGGAGVFCLMNAGSFGTNPSPPNGYLRHKAGWGTAETITASTNSSRSLTAESNGRLANNFLIHYNPSNSQEYFLIENRYKNDRDAGLPTGGIAVWHVDEQGNHNYQNYGHQTTHNNYEVALIQADNQRNFERNTGSGNVNTLYYGGGISSQFSDTSDTGPYDNNAHWWSGAYSGLKLSSFSAKGNTMSLMVGAPVVAVTVTVSPSSANINTGTTKQFSASVTGTTNTAVTWSTTGGTVSSSGLYTAPATAGTYTVRATSVANTSKFATATVVVSKVTTTYALSVNNGNGDGSYPAGNAVTITADTPSAGKVFDRWVVNSGNPVITNAAASTTTLKIGTSAATVTATYKSTGGTGGPAGYTWCASEGGSCTFNSKVDVAYGANGTYSYKYGVTGTITFNNANFGDPTPNVAKAGYYKAAPAILSYVLRARHSGLVLTVAAGSTSDGGNINQGSYTGASHQKWQFVSAGDGSYFLKSQSSGKYLDVAGVSSADGANVHQWTYTGAGNQRWLLQGAGDGYYFLKAQFSGKYLDVSGVSTAVGANVHQWSYTGAGNQQWKIELVN